MFAATCVVTVNPDCTPAREQINYLSSFLRAAISGYNDHFHPALARRRLCPSYLKSKPCVAALRPSPVARSAIAAARDRDCSRSKSLPILRSLRRRIVGRKIASVGRVGKRIVLELDSRDRLVIEPRMSGSVILANPRDRTHLRLDSSSSAIRRAVAVLGPARIGRGAIALAGRVPVALWQ